MKQQSEKLTASEALFGFCAWLTCRDKPLILSSKHNATYAVKAIEQFMIENNLEEPRDGWENNLIHPSGECSGCAK